MTLWTDFLGAEISWLNAGGVATRVVTLGHGDAVVLLHGRGGHLESWSANIAELGRRFHVVAFDLLGHGLTGRRDCAYTVDDLVSHAVATLGALEFTRSVLVGQSLGGWVAARLALDRPELVERLVLVEPAGLQSEQERLADPAVASAYERGGRAFVDPTTRSVRERLEGLMLDPGLVSDELVNLRLRLYEPDAARRVHRLVRAADNDVSLLTVKTLADLRAPVLIVHGESGHLPHDLLEGAADAIPDARLVTLAGAKQWPQWEQPETFNRTVVDFLQAA